MTRRGPRGHWIELELFDSDGKTPVPRARYVVIAPDGQRFEGRLDSHGFRHIDGIRRAGQCQIEFPGIQVNDR
jgi:hypothetical protein